MLRYVEISKDEIRPIEHPVVSSCVIRLVFTSVIFHQRSYLAYPPEIGRVTYMCRVPFFETACVIDA